MRRRISAAIFLFLLAGLGLASAEPPASRTVDAWPGSIDDATTRAVYAPDGQPYVVYTPQDAQATWSVRLGRWSGAQWQTVLVAGGLADPPLADFAIDGHGLAHVVFVKNANGRALQHVAFLPAGFVGNNLILNEVVAPLPQQVATVALELQSNGEPAVAWSDAIPKTWLAKRSSANARWNPPNQVIPCDAGLPTLTFDTATGADVATLTCRQTAVAPGTCQR